MSDLNAYSRESKKLSIDRSIIVAYTLAERPIDYDLDGIKVLFRYEDFPIYRSIRIGDRIVGLNDSRIHSVDELKTELSKFETCGNVTLKVITKKNKLKTIQTELVEVDGECKLVLRSAIIIPFDRQNQRSSRSTIRYGGSAGSYRR